MGCDRSDIFCFGLPPCGVTSVTGLKINCHILIGEVWYCVTGQGKNYVSWSRATWHDYMQPSKINVTLLENTGWRCIRVVFPFLDPSPHLPFGLNTSIAGYPEMYKVPVDGFDTKESIVLQYKPIGARALAHHL